MVIDPAVDGLDEEDAVARAEGGEGEANTAAGREVEHEVTTFDAGIADFLPEDDLESA